MFDLHARPLKHFNSCSHWKGKFSIALESKTAVDFQGLRSGDHL